jgi:hypothetical protein
MWIRRAVTMLSATALLAGGMAAFASPAQAAIACTNSDFAGGDGTSGTPYQVASAIHLANASACAAGKFFIQTADIDLTGVTWVPGDLNGFYNGNNKTIRNLALNSSTLDAGLFKSISQPWGNLQQSVSLESKVFKYAEKNLSAAIMRIIIHSPVFPTGRQATMSGSVM